MSRWMGCLSQRDLLNQTVRRGALGLMLVMFAALVACGGKAEVPPEFERGVSLVRYFASPRYLGNSMYSATVEQHKPSELISYLFSTMGAAEWPPSEDSLELTKEQARTTRTPLVPSNIRLRPLAPDNQPGLQLVLKPDDARKMIIVEGYVLPNQTPIAKAEVGLSEIPQGRRSDPQ